MIKLQLFAILVAVFALGACNKHKGFKEYDIQVISTKPSGTLSYNAGVYQATYSMPAPFSKELEGKKIIELTSVADLDSLMVYATSESIDGIKVDDMFGDVDFNAFSIFVFQVDYRSQGGDDNIKRSDVLINEDTEEILFDYKRKIRVGGSGMFDTNILYFMTVPIEHTGFTFKGTYEIVEQGSSSSDYILSYSQ